MSKFNVLTAVSKNSLKQRGRIKKVFFKTIKPRKPRQQPKQYELKLNLKEFNIRKAEASSTSQDVKMN